MYSTKEGFNKGKNNTNQLNYNWFLQENKQRVVKINGYLIITLLIVNPPLMHFIFSLFKVPCYLSKP